MVASAAPFTARRAVAGSLPGGLVVVFQQTTDGRMGEAPTEGSAMSERHPMRRPLVGAEHPSSVDGVDRRRFLTAAAAGGAAAWLAPAVSSAEVAPGLSPGVDYLIRTRAVFDCLDQMVVDLIGLPAALHDELWNYYAQAGIAVTQGDGDEAIAQLTAARAQVAANLALLNAAQGGLRSPGFPGEGGLGDGFAAALDFLIVLGPSEIVTRTEVVPVARVTALVACDEALAACLGRPFSERPLPYPLLFFPAPLGDGLFAAATQTLDGALGNPPCYAAFYACVAAS